MSDADDGRRAWQRLTRPVLDGTGALAALADIGLVRRLLERAELDSVRTARQHGKSWAEIATQLGVSRQSAWERWRELDDDAAPEPQRDLPDVRVPNVVGLPLDAATQVLSRADLTPASAHPDTPLVDLMRSGAVVVDQSPESGAFVAPGSPVRLWIERGGGSGVREPRRPTPTELRGRAMQDEPT